MVLFCRWDSNSSARRDVTITELWNLTEDDFSELNIPQPVNPPDSNPADLADEIWGYSVNSSDANLENLKNVDEDRCSFYRIISKPLEDGAR